jgi:hypothetical protein
VNDNFAKFIWSQLLARRTSEAEENHWPGFVDVLSTLVMVVTFILIILAIALITMTQNISNSFIKTTSEKTAKGGGDIASAKNLNAQGEFTATEKVPPSSIDSIVTTSRFSAKLADELESSHVDQSTNDLSVLSRNVSLKERRVTVAPLDKTIELAPTAKVSKSEHILSINFPAASSKLDESALTEVKNYVNENSNVLKDRKLSIWSFFNANEMSISEGRRTAYYRALATRNQLIEAGILPENINVQIRNVEKLELSNIVQVVISE